MISIVMATYNRVKFLKTNIEYIEGLLESEFGQDYHHTVDFHVIDTGSTDGSRDYLLSCNRIVSTFLPRTSSWCKFINYGFKSAKHEFIFMLSDDTFPHPDIFSSIKTCLRMGIPSNIGMMAFPFHDLDVDLSGKYKVLSLNGHIMLNHGIYRKSALEIIGFADEETYDNIYCGDSDVFFSMKKAGYDLLILPNCLLVHNTSSHNHPTVDGTLEGKFSVSYKRLAEKWSHYWSNFIQEPDIQPIYFDYETPRFLLKMLRCL